MSIMPDQARNIVVRQSGRAGPADLITVRRRQVR